ncbi:unnamed protein product, partial [Oppiella nova]
MFGFFRNALNAINKNMSKVSDESMDVSVDDGVENHSPDKDVSDADD